MVFQRRRTNPNTGAVYVSELESYRVPGERNPRHKTLRSWTENGHFQGEVAAFDAIIAQVAKEDALAAAKDVEQTDHNKNDAEAKSKETEQSHNDAASSDRSSPSGGNGEGVSGGGSQVGDGTHSGELQTANNEANNSANGKGDNHSDNDTNDGVGDVHGGVSEAPS